MDEGGFCGRGLRRRCFNSSVFMRRSSSVWFNAGCDCVWEGELDDLRAFILSWYDGAKDGPICARSGDPISNANIPPPGVWLPCRALVSVCGERTRELASGLLTGFGFGLRARLAASNRKSIGEGLC